VRADPGHPGNGVRRRRRTTPPRGHRPTRTPRPPRPAGGEALDPAPSGSAGPAPPPGRETHPRAGVRREVPPLDVPDAHVGLLRPRGPRRGRARPRNLRLPPGRPGRDPLPQDPRPVLAEHPPLRRLGRAVLRHHRAPTPRRPALPRRHPRVHPPGRAAGHRGRDGSRGVLARPRRDRLLRQAPAAVGRPGQGVRRPRHPGAAADLGSGDRPGHADRAVARGAVRGAGAREGHPRRDRGGRTAHRVPDQVPDERRRPRRRPRRHRDRSAARAPPPPRRRTPGHPVLAALPGLAHLRRPTQGRPVGNDAGAVQGQGPSIRAPGHRRTGSGDRAQSRAGGVPRSPGVRTTSAMPPCRAGWPRGCRPPRWPSARGTPSRCC
jgi:hypothetical protein